MKNILVATDLSARSDRAIQRALKLAKNYGAKLTILHVVDEDNPESIHKELAKLAKKEIFTAVEGKTQNIDYKIEVVTGTPHLKILQVAVKIKADLIVLGLHRHASQDQSIMGQVVQRIIKNSLKPVLVVKERTEFEYKKILVALDFNSHSKSSFKLALNLFPEANFTLLHSYFMPILGSIGISANQLEQEYKEYCEKEIASTVKDVSKDIAKSHKTKTEATYKIKNKLIKGPIIEVLKEELQSSKQQLMVIGTHGRSGISKFLSINVAENFLIDPPCDVLVTI